MWMPHENTGHGINKSQCLAHIYLLNNNILLDKGQLCGKVINEYLLTLQMEDKHSLPVNCVYDLKLDINNNEQT